MRGIWYLDNRESLGLYLREIGISNWMIVECREISKKISLPNCKARDLPISRDKMHEDL